MVSRESTNSLISHHSHNRDGNLGNLARSDTVQAVSRACRCAAAALLLCRCCIAAMLPPSFCILAVAALMKRMEGEVLNMQDLYMPPAFASLRYCGCAAAVVLLCCCRAADMLLFRCLCVAAVLLLCGYCTREVQLVRSCTELLGGCCEQMGRVVLNM